MSDGAGCRSVMEARERSGKFLALGAKFHQKEIHKFKAIGKHPEKKLWPKFQFAKLEERKVLRSQTNRFGKAKVKRRRKFKEFEAIVQKGKSCRYAKWSSLQSSRKKSLEVTDTSLGKRK